jgi:hypothetical protein
MKPIKPEELSALLDGELEPGRADEVRRAISEDAGLRELHRRLADMDNDLNAFAAACQFNPRLSPPSDVPAFNISISGISVWPVAVCLLIVHCLAKVLPFSSSIGIQLAALALLVVWLFRLLLPRFTDDSRQAAREVTANSA